MKIVLDALRNHSSNGFGHYLHFRSCHILVLCYLGMIDNAVRFCTRAPNIMKKLKLAWKGCTEEDFDFIEVTTRHFDIIDNGQFYLNDMATGCRILSSQDILELEVTSEQELAVKLRFGDKISEKV